MGARTDEAVEPDLLKRVMGRFASGVTVVTANGSDGSLAGCTVNAFCSVSLVPPLVLISIGRQRAFHSVLTRSKGFEISILSEHQSDTALTFATPTEDRFSRISYSPRRFGVEIDGASAHISCHHHQAVHAGDHTLFLGRVCRLALTHNRPLLYTDAAFVQLAGEASDRGHSHAPEWLLTAPW